MQPFRTIRVILVGDQLGIILLSLVKFLLAVQEKKSFKVFLI